jgi:DNA-binding response OmpR family regulator
MPAICPNCHNPLQLEQVPLRKDIRMSCSSCRAALTVSLVVSLDAPSASADSVSGRRPPVHLNEKKVAAAVEGDASNEMIREILSQGGFEMVSSTGTEDLLALLERERPVIVIVDVGILDIIGFEIADRIKKRDDLKEIGIILLASIHDKTRYKREPESLYGAQDYIERHHIQDQLLPKVQRILEGRNAKSPIPESNPPAFQPTHELPASALEETIATIAPQKAKTLEKAMSIENVFDQMVEEERKPVHSPTPAPEIKKPQAKPDMLGDPATHAAAKRLARIIISDIALYNQRALEDGVRNGTIYESLRDEIEEGKKLYEGRVPSEIVSSTDYYREAIDEFVRKRKLELQNRT